MKGNNMFSKLMNNNDVSPIATKTCSRCKNELPLDDFSNYKLSKDGKRPWCKKCCNEYAKEQAKKKKLIESEKSISKSITKGKIDDIFDVKNLQDIPTAVRKQFKIPKNLLTEKDDPNILRNQIVNMLRRLVGREVHIAQLSVAYFRMYNSFISNRNLSLQLTIIGKRDNNLIHNRKGWYKYINPDVEGHENEKTAI